MAAAVSVDDLGAHDGRREGAALSVAALSSTQRRGLHERGAPGAGHTAWEGEPEGGRGGERKGRRGGSSDALIGGRAGSSCLLQPELWQFAPGTLSSASSRAEASGGEVGGIGRGVQKGWRRAARQFYNSRGIATRRPDGTCAVGETIVRLLPLPVCNRECDRTVVYGTAVGSVRKGKDKYIRGALAFTPSCGQHLACQGDPVPPAPCCSALLVISAPALPNRRP
ncbi:hypothetical protein IQ07DRAFT_335669 [Pyrenochaeta sp. DS3sAY3a]|nr:hypothetical protein IQ07DRAFT_335669 [Pyrenochaeta sp. DS3sAY3a]